MTDIKTLLKNPAIVKVVQVVAGNLVKRYSASHKSSVAKVAQHLNLAKLAHAKGMGHLAKAAACMTEAKKLGKAADAGALAGHIASAHEAFGASADHMDDMDAYLDRAMKAWAPHQTAVSEDDEVGGEITLPSLSDMTEGEVPEYTSDDEYGAVMAMAGGGKKLKHALASGAVVPKEQVDKLVAAAAEKAAAEAKTVSLTSTVESLQKQVEALLRQPAAGSPKVKIFDVTKSGGPSIDLGGGDEAEQTAKLGKLLEGVDTNIQDEHSFTTAAGRMIGNMIKNGPKFGQRMFGKPPMFDPTFHGRGGTGSRN